MAENQTINQEKMPHENYFVVLSIDNPQFATYLIVSSLLILKMCGLTLLTIFHRQKNKTQFDKFLVSYMFCNNCISPEDLYVAFSTIFQCLPFYGILSKSKLSPQPVFISDEDTKMAGGAVDSHPTVERVRRAVLNDLENIPVFLVIGLAYLFVGVPDWVVHFLFYLFLIARVLHSFVYAVYVVPQPARAICFLIGFFITVYLSFHVLVYGFFVGYLGK